MRDTDAAALTWAIPRALWPLSSVLVGYILAAFLIPTLAPVSISDDWTYARSVEYLVNDGRFHILPIAAATQVFQLFWGASFAFIFGMSFGVLRVSTIALVLLSGLAMYGMCRELGVDPSRSALGVAVYLFNPVLFPITYSFMSDPHFLALLVISSYWYLRGLRPGADGDRALVAGSVVAALAVLQRPHGAMIPLGVVTYLLVSGRLRADRAGAIRFARIVAIPATTFLGYYLVVARGLPSQQGLFLDEIRGAGWDETWLLIRRLTVIELMYLGLFILPIVTGLLGVLGGVVTLKSRRAWLSFALWSGILLAGLGWFWGSGRRMPYIPHFLSQGGPGAGDLRHSRAPLAGSAVFDWITIACAVAAALFALALMRTLDDRGTPHRPAAGMALGIASWQAVGVVPQSFLFRNWVISLDRYLLPLLPFAIALLLWALNGRRLHTHVAWAAVAAVGLFSVIGTRDALVFQQNVWTLAGSMNAAGVDDTRLDAGYAWDAYHLWEFSERNHIPRQTPHGTWWTDVYATATDSTYLIAGGSVPGYDILSRQPLSKWLDRTPQHLYVLRRAGAPSDGIRWGRWKGEAVSGSNGTSRTDVGPGIEFGDARSARDR